MTNINKIYAESNLDKIYSNYLKNPNIKIISFDIFDTFLFRNVEKATDVFLNIGKKKRVKELFSNAGNFQEMRISAEKKAREDYKSIGEINLKLIYSYFPLNEKEKKRLMKLEILEERKVLQINPHINKWIKKAIKSNKKVIFISDFYLGKNDLKNFISNLSPQIVNYTNIYVSCDLKKTKFKGDIFEEVINKENIEVQELLHIGDNRHSDYNIPIKLGINALYYNCSDYLQNIYQLENQYSFKLSKIWNRLGKQASIYNPYENQTESFFYNLGAGIFGSILWSFTHWILDICKKYNIKQVNYLMREGQIFEKALKIVNLELDVNLIYASRKSTFLASVDINKIKNGEFNFYGYENFSLKNLYELFEINTNSDFIKSHYNHSFSNHSVFSQKEFEILSYVSEEFKSKTDEIISNIEKKRELLNLYFKQLEIKNDSILLDFGGKGTILKTLNSILFPESKSNVNALFYKNDESYEKNIGCNFISYLKFNEKNREKITLIKNSPSFIEVLFNGNNETTLDYKVMQNHKISPYLEKNNQLNEQISSLLAFEKGIFTFFELAKEENLSPKIFTRNAMLDRLARIIDLPSKEEAYYLGNLIHEAGFGSSHKFPIINPNHIEWIQEKGCKDIFHKYKTNLPLGINDVHWIQGTITRVDNNFLQSLNKNFQVDHTSNKSLESIKKLILKIENFGKLKEVYIYGAGYIFENIHEYLFFKDIKIIGVIDTRAEFTEIKIKNYNVQPLKNINLKNNDIIIIASDKFSNDIETKIIDYTKKNNTIVQLIKI